MPKVVKKIVKGKASETTVENDRKAYEKAYLAAKKIHDTSEMSLSQDVAGMADDDLDKVREYLQHDKGTAARKKEVIASFASEYRECDAIVKKLAVAMDRWKSMIADALEDDEGNFSKLALNNELIRVKALHDGMRDGATLARGMDLS